MLITAPSDMNKGEVEATPKIIKKWKTSANAPVPQRYSHSKSLQVTRLYSVNWKITSNDQRRNVVSGPRQDKVRKTCPKAASPTVFLKNTLKN